MEYCINKSKKKYFAELLANQERSLLKYSKSQAKFESLSIKISNTTNKRKNDLLLLNSDDYRIKNELLNKFENSSKILEKEHYYNWYDELRIVSNTNSDNLNNLYYIRNLLKKYKIIKNSIFKKKFKGFKNVRKIVNDVNKASHNFEGLIVKGQNLLQLEYDYVKNLKNKKIIMRLICHQKNFKINALLIKITYNFFFCWKSLQGKEY